MCSSWRGPIGRLRSYCNMETNGILISKEITYTITSFSNSFVQTNEWFRMNVRSEQLGAQKYYYREIIN